MSTERYVTTQVPDNSTEDEDGLGGARGVIIGLMLSLPFLSVLAWLVDF